MRTHSTATKLLQGSLLLAIGLFHTGISQADALAPGTLNVVSVDIAEQGTGTSGFEGDSSAYVVDSFGALFSYLTLNPIGNDPEGRFKDIYRIVVNNRLPQSSAVPRMVAQPNPAIAYVGQTHTLSATTDKQQGVSYQWWKNGTFQGAGHSELVLSNLTVQDSGWYKVLASNTSGSAVSDTVYLDVREGSPTGEESPLEPPPTAENEQQEASGTAMIRWAAPTVRVDGSALEPGDITGYRVYQGSEARGWYRYHQVNDPYLNFVGIEGLPPDTYYFAISVIDQYGQESEPTELGYKTIAATPLVVGS